MRTDILCKLSEISSIFWVTETKHGFGTGHLLTEGRLDKYVHVNNIHGVNILEVQIGIVEHHRCASSGVIENQIHLVPGIFQMR